MTTEIAVINRLGVVLATDSAVTISGGGKSKVFDTGDKLFELSETRSIGVMINGSMDLLGVPWEVLIKDFRASRPDDAPRSMRDWTMALFDFIGRHKVMNADAESEFVEQVAHYEFRGIRRSLARELFQLGPKADEKVEETIGRLVAQRRATFSGKGRAESLDGLVGSEVAKVHAKAVDRAMNDAFDPFPLPRPVRTRLRALVMDALLSKEPSEFSTGLIVAGYGDGDIFPSIAMADVEGSLGGRLKHSVTDHMTIDRRNHPGRIISFAQTDVIERILSGVDHSFVEKSAQYIKSAIGSARDRLVPLLSGANIPEDTASMILDDIAATISDEYMRDFADNARSSFRGDFNEMVALMPKQDIIELAEALVSITAVERKASSEQATVGGPVDVAFINKHEGFVWIKRKHYFDAQLNPRYFWRKKQQLTSTSGAGDPQ